MTMRPSSRPIPLPRRPAPLGAGARVRLLAPAGPLRGEQDLADAERNARAMGWEPSIGRSALERDGYLAGEDAARLGDLNDALRDPDIDAIWALRGGYGVMRLLEVVDVETLLHQPRTLIGYSDITALHHTFATRAGLSGVHGPCARGALSAFSRESLASAAAGVDSCGVAAGARVLKEGRARGPLTGGNLALVSALIGTPFLFLPPGAILVLEDANEPVYRVDRMLRQLRLAGMLSRCAGLVFGAFTERGPSEPEVNDDAALDRVLREAAEVVDGPCIAGAPVGHVADQWSWPFGAMAELDGVRRRLRTGPDIG